MESHVLVHPSCHCMVAWQLGSQQNQLRNKQNAWGPMRESQNLERSREPSEGKVVQGMEAERGLSFRVIVPIVTYQTNS